ncbi:MAG: transporter [Blastocatellia bacterium]|nr:transporter [Blastocatellia bacterium]
MHNVATRRHGDMATRRWIASLCLFLFATLLAIPASAQQRPLITEDVEIVKPGSVRFDFGFDFLQDKDYMLSGLNGDLSRLGVVNLTIGLAPNVEIESGGVIQNFLSVNRQFRPSPIPIRLSQGTNSTHDAGDFYLAAKIKLRNETRRAPAVGFRFAAELPNSNQERGIGLNQTNFYATVLAGKSFGRLRVYGNLGLGILTAPLDRFTQNDVLLYGLAATWRFNDRVTMVGELNGRYSTRGNPPLGTESDGAARFGARIRAGGLMWDVAGLRGLHRNSERSGVTFGVSYEGHLFEPIK